MGTLLFTFLQVIGASVTAEAQMTQTDLNNSVHQLTESSVALAEAAANFGALKVIFGAFLVFTFIIMCTFLWQLVASQKKINEIHKSAKGVEACFNEASNRTIGKGQAQIMIRRAFNSIAQNVKYTILRTRLEGNLEQEDYIKSKSARLVKYEWGELQSFLSNYEYEGMQLSECIIPEDSEQVLNFILEQVYMDKSIFSISQMDQGTDIIINGIKQQALLGID